MQARGFCNRKRIPETIWGPLSVGAVVPVRKGDEEMRRQEVSRATLSLAGELQGVHAP